MRIVDGVYEEVRDDAPEVVRALTAGGGPLYPPTHWFEDPQLDRPTPMTITSDGRIFGHIAPWDADHIGLPPGTKPPHSRTGYSYFHTGTIKLDDDSEIPCGQITLAGGHAPLQASAEAAVEHYDNTASAIADVIAGEDAHGIWVSGGLRPEVTDTQIRALRASAPSGDWRPIDHSLEMVAICQTNVPGFPLARSLVAGGEVLALVAAGAARMYSLQRDRSVLADVEAASRRIEILEEAILAGGRKKVVPPRRDEEENDEPERNERTDNTDEPETKIAEDRKKPPADEKDEARRALLRKKFAARHK